MIRTGAGYLDVLRATRNARLDRWRKFAIISAMPRMGPRKYSVREYKRSDERAVGEIEAQMIATLRRTYRPKPSLIASSDEQAGNRRKLVALDEGIPVGATDYVIQNGAVHFMAMGVRRDRRGQGIGRCLVSAAVEIARERKLTKVTLRTIRETGNVEVFERLGFRVVAETLETEAIAVVANASLTDVLMEMPV